MSTTPNVVLADPATVFSVQTLGGTTRELVDGARAAVLLEPLLSPDAAATGARIEKMVIGGKSFGAEAGAVVASALKAVPGLRYADFADCIAGRPADEACETLQILSDGLAAAGVKLESLDLSDNALGLRGVPYLANAFANQSSLRHLYFNNGGLQAEAVEILTKMIMQNFGGMEGRTELRTFEIGHNCLEDAGFLALIPLVERSPELRQLRIATTRVRNNQGAGLAMSKALLGLKHLTSLALNDNNLGVEAGSVLASVIEQNAPHLRSLNLGDIGVEEEGIEAVLTSATKIAPNTLEHLDLAANELNASSTFMKPLCSVLRKQAASLRYLKLEDNELKSRGASKLLRALARCTRLEYLNLNNNQLGARVAPQLVAFLRAHPTLTEVHLNGNRFTTAQVDELREAVTRDDAMQTMSDNDEEEESSEEEASEEEEEEEESEETPAAQDAEVDALADGLAATKVNNDQ